MKPVKILLMLAALAGVSAHAVTASSFNGGPTPSGGTGTALTGSDGLVKAHAAYNSSGIWIGMPIAKIGQDSDGVGVVSNAGSDAEVEGSYREYIVLDFSGTATGSVAVTAVELNFPVTPQNPYFVYQWVSAVPTTGATSPSVPGSFVSVTTPLNVTSGLTSFTSIAGSGTYLMLGAINGSFSTTNYFSVKSVSYTSVPDGASTLALMGAAIATLGFAARRRRA